MTDIIPSFSKLYKEEGILATIKAIDDAEKQGSASKAEAKRARDYYLTQWGGEKIFRILSKGAFLMLQDVVYKRVKDYLVIYGRNATKEGLIKELNGFGLTSEKQQALRALDLKFN